MDFKALKRQCAACLETAYEKCKACTTYKILNTECDFCHNIGGVMKFNAVFGVYNTCPCCMSKFGKS